VRAGDPAERVRTGQDGETEGEARRGHVGTGRDRGTHADEDEDEGPERLGGDLLGGGGGVGHVRHASGRSPRVRGCVPRDRLSP